MSDECLSKRGWDSLSQVGKCCHEPAAARVGACFIQEESGWRELVSGESGGRKRFIDPLTFPVREIARSRSPAFIGSRRFADTHGSGWLPETDSPVEFWKMDLHCCGNCIPAVSIGFHRLATLL